MDSFESMRIQVSNNLKLLSTQEFIKRRKENIEINSETFRKLSPKAFQLITYHLFKTLDSNECNKRFIGCFPVLDRKQESEFRQSTNKWLQEIVLKESEWHIPRVVPIYFQHFTPEPTLCHLYLQFSNYVLYKEIQKMSCAQGVRPLAMSALNAITCEATEKSLSEYELTKTAIQDETQGLAANMQYFVDSYNEITESLKSWSEQKNQLLGSVAENYGLNSDSNVDQFISERFDRLRDEVNALKKSLHSMDQLVDNKWRNYSIAFESETNSLSDSVIDLKQFIGENESQRFESFGALTQELMSRTEDYESIVQKVSDNDLNKFCDVSTKLLNEIQSYKKHLNQTRDQLKSFVDRLKSLSEKRRTELLSSSEIIERRKWLEERTVDITRIKFKFEPKPRPKAEVKPALEVLIEKEVSDESPVFRPRPSLVDYSFQVMDISTCHYIPPSGSPEHSRLLFSPVENKKVPEN